MLSSHVLTVSVFVLLGLAFLGLEVAGHASRWPVPTLGRVVSGLLRRRSARIGILLAWWWLGWHFLAP